MLRNRYETVIHNGVDVMGVLATVELKNEHETVKRVLNIMERIKMIEQLDVYMKLDGIHMRDDLIQNPIFRNPKIYCERRPW